MTGKIVTASPEHEATYAELSKLISRHGDKVTVVETLAIAANIVGKLIAMQDQRTMTGEQAEQIVRHNIEIGNREALEALMASIASA